MCILFANKKNQSIKDYFVKVELRNLMTALDKSIYLRVKSEGHFIYKRYLLKVATYKIVANVNGKRSEFLFYMYIKSLPLQYPTLSKLMDVGIPS